MNDTTPVVRWRRRGYKGVHGNHRFTRWHLETPIPADRFGRTACGIRFARNQSESGSAADGELCRNCLRALGGTEPGRDTTQEIAA